MYLSISLFLTRISLHLSIFHVSLYQVSMPTSVLLYLTCLSQILRPLSHAYLLIRVLTQGAQVFLPPLLPLGTTVDYATEAVQAGTGTEFIKPCIAALVRALSWDLVTVSPFASTERCCSTRESRTPFIWSFNVDEIGEGVSRTTTVVSY